MRKIDEPSVSSTTTPETGHPEISAEHWDVIVIGGGAAGLSAALILARARRRVLVIGAQEPRNRFAPHIHGFLSRDGYSPLDLVTGGYREVRAVDGVIANDRVTATRAIASGFELETESGSLATTRRVIVATGGRDQLPNIPGLAEQWGRGVVACPYCDGYEAIDRTIGVLAGSVAGLHKAHMLRSYSSSITVFTELAGAIPEADRRIFEERGMHVEARAVLRVLTEGGMISGLELADGSVTPVDVVFAEPAVIAQDEPLRQLGAERRDTPLGPWTAVDEVGRTSIDGVWAVGNAANPAALVPIAAGSGAAAALALNAEFIAEDVAAASDRVAWAMDQAAPESLTHPAQYWEARYLSNRGENGQMWSGRVNAAVEHEVAALVPATALELGCGEGADALWLASQGWTVTAIDISSAALAVGAAKAAKAGLTGRIHWVQADLTTWQPAAEFDLVTSAFLHSPVDLPREEVLRRAASAVAPGGRLLVVGHGAFPAGSKHSEHDHDALPLPTSEEVLASLELSENWVVESNAPFDRLIPGESGNSETVSDTVLRVRRG